MKNQITNQQMKVDHEFFQCCQKMDLEGIRNLYEQFPKTEKKEKLKKSKFIKFLKLIKIQVPTSLEPPTIDFFASDCSGIISLANKGDIDSLSYIISLPLFKEQLDELNELEKYRFADAFFNAASRGHMNCAHILAPLIEHERIFLHTFERFIVACENGDLNTVKFLTTTPLLKNNASCMLNGAYSDIRNDEAEGFRTACENGHLDVVKYLTSDPQLINKVNVDLITQPIYIEDRSIINYFFFDLKANDRFLRLVAEPEVLDELIKKRKIFNDLSYELHNKDENNSSKRLKI